jgi:hypothetical protein
MSPVPGRRSPVKHAYKEVNTCGAGLASSAVDSYAVGNSVDAVQSGTIIRFLTRIGFAFMATSDKLAVGGDVGIVPYCTSS